MNNSVVREDRGETNANIFTQDRYQKDDTHTPRRCDGNILINGALFSVFATTLTKPPWNTNTHHRSINGSAGSAVSPPASLTNLPMFTFFLQCRAYSQWILRALPSLSTYVGGFMERCCFDTLKLLPHDQTSKYLLGQQRATPRQLTMQHLNISRMQSVWYTGEETGSRSWDSWPGLER